MKLDNPKLMNMRIAFVLTGSLVLAACGAGKANEALGRAPAKVTDDGISYPRTFSGTAELHDSLSSQGIASVSYDASDVDSTFGCSEGGAGSEFVFYMKTGDDQFKMTFAHANFRESLSSYPNLDEVELGGRILGLNFDRSKQDYQVQHCEARDISRSAGSMSGVVECFNVTGLGSKDQATFTLRFRCDIVGR